MNILIEWNMTISIRMSEEKNKVVLPSGFEPESQAREAHMIGRYTTGAADPQIIRS